MAEDKAYYDSLGKTYAAEYQRKLDEAVDILYKKYQDESDAKYQEAAKKIQQHQVDLFKQMGVNE